MPTAAAVMGCVGGSAVLAFWVVVRFRNFGPQVLRSCLIVCAVALALLEVVQGTAATVADATNSALALVCLVVPVFGFAFWSGGVLVRAFLAGPMRMNRRP